MCPTLNCEWSEHNWPNIMNFQCSWFPESLSNLRHAKIYSLTAADNLVCLLARFLTTLSLAIVLSLSVKEIICKKILGLLKYK